MDRLEKSQAWWKRRQIRSERTQCPAVHTEKEAQNQQPIQLNLFNHKTFVFVCSHSGHLFAKFQSADLFRPPPIREGHRDKSTSDSSPPFPPLSLPLQSLSLSLSFRSLIATSSCLKLMFSVFFSLGFGSASWDLDLSPLSGKLSTPKDPHCYFTLGSLSAVDLLSPLSSPLQPAFMFSGSFQMKSSDFCSFSICSHTTL